MFSKTCIYGIRAVIYLAVHSGETKRIGVSDLANELGVPRHFLAKVLQKLGKEGLISSSKGPGGGFFLSNDQQEFTLAQVVTCLDGEDVFTRCVLGFESCSNENPCPLHLQAYAFREGLKYQLMHHTVREIAFRVNREQINI